MNKAPLPCTLSQRAEIEELLLRREDDSLSASDTRRLNAHLAACPGCRAVAIESDPTLLFSRLSASGEGRPDPRLAPEAQRVVSDVLAAIEVDRTRRRLASGSRRTLLRLAAGLLVATGLGGAWAVKRGGAPLIQTAQKDEARALRPTVPAPASAESVAAAAVSRPLIEGVQSPDATIYQFAASAPGEPSVVFIVDKNADI